MANPITSLSRIFNSFSGRKKSISLQSYRLSKRASAIADVDIAQLTQQGIRGIILDLDNTIVSEDDTYLSPQAEDWIRQAKLAGFSFFILSNGKRHYRVRYWSKRLNMPTISPAKKPFPQSFHKAMTFMNLSPDKVVVIGDSFHTDVMGAKICGCHCIQVATLPHPPRWWERIAGKWVQQPYPKKYELWDFNAAVYRGTSDIH